MYFRLLKVMCKCAHSGFVNIVKVLECSENKCITRAVLIFVNVLKIKQFLMFCIYGECVSLVLYVII